MTIDSAPETPLEAQSRAERLHEWVVDTLGVDTEDALVTVHRDGAISVQLAPGVGRGDEPTVHTMDLPYGRSGYTGSYGDAPGLSMNIHADYAAEVDVPAMRRDAVAVLARVVDEMDAETKTNR